MAVGLQSTLAQQGYASAHNMYNILANGGKDTDDDTTVVMITKMATAATTGSTLANTYTTLAPAPAPTDYNITSANNPLAANQ